MAIPVLKVWDAAAKEWKLVATGAPTLPIVTTLNTIDSDTTIGNNNNALSVGPLTIATGVTVTVQDGSVWAVI